MQIILVTRVYLYPAWEDAVARHGLGPNVSDLAAILLLLVGRRHWVVGPVVDYSSPTLGILRHWDLHHEIADATTSLHLHKINGTTKKV